MSITDPLQKALAKVKEDIEVKKKLWTSVNTWRVRSVAWMGSVLSRLSLEKMAAELNGFAATVADCARVMYTSSVINYMKNSLDQVKYN